MKLFSRLWQERVLILLILVQLGLAAFLIAIHPRLWPSGDSPAYVNQALQFRLGGFPYDPSRPILYPFILSLVIRLFGFSVLWMRIFQAIVLGLSTALAYRLALIISGRKAAILTAAIFVIFIDNVFYSSLLYRESLTAFFFIASLNLIQMMLAKPERRVFGFYAGVCSGLLVLIKPEFSSMLFLMALYGLWLFVRTRNFRSHFLPWVVCGAVCLATIFPMILTMRAQFGDWIFINTYKGFNYYLSYCGELDPAGAPESEKTFFQKDNERYGRLHRTALDHFYLADPRIPFKQRDDRLMEMAVSCVRENPGRSFRMLAMRGLETIFMLNSGGADFIASGEFGRSWPLWAAPLVRIFGIALNLSVILLLGPGFWSLRKKRFAWPVLVSVVWFALYYATPTYYPRFQVPVWPALALIAGHGASYLSGSFKQKGAVGGMVLWSGVVLILIMIAMSPVGAGLFNPGLYKAREIRARQSQAELGQQISIYAISFQVNRRGDLLERDLGKFIRDRKDTLEPETLIKQGEMFESRRFFTTAKFMYLLALEFPDATETAQAELDRIERRRRRERLVEWKLIGKFQDRGIAVYSSPTSSLVLANPESPPLDMRLEFHGLSFDYNPEIVGGEDYGPYEWAFREREVLMTLPLSEPAPGPSVPLDFSYYSEPKQ